MLQEYQSDTIVITDTSCLILLHKLDALDILAGMFKNVVTTSQIAAEFGQNLPEWVQVKKVADEQMIKRYLKKVDIGEASAIALTHELPDAILVLDDLKGRKLAAQLKIKYTGTLGIFILARQQNLISQLKPYFDKIKTTDFRISPALLQEILESVGEA